MNPQKVVHCPQNSGSSNNKHLSKFEKILNKFLNTTMPRYS